MFLIADAGRMAGLNRSRGSLPILLFSALILCGAAGASRSEVAPVAVAARSMRVHLVTSGGTNADAMGEYLRHFLEARQFPVAPGVGRSLPAQPGGGTWVLSETNDLTALGIKWRVSELDAAGSPESFWLKAEPTAAGPRLLLVAKSPAGLQAAVSSLTCRLANYGSELTLPPGAGFHTPFIRQRILDLGNSARRQVPEGSPFKPVDVETWPAERLKAYPELFWQFGFNAVQIEEVRGYGPLSDPQLPRVRNALITLAEAAHARGMRVSLFQWGDCLYQEGTTHSWNNPAEQKAILAFADDLAQAYARRVDHVNVHFGDPGGCLRDGCDSYQTPQQVTAAYCAAFRKLNPAVEFTLSTWAWGDFWASCPRLLDRSNYAPYFPEMAKSKEFHRPIPGGAGFLDATFMPLDIGIALHRTYNRDQANAVLAAGRPVDVWTWYVGDNEMLNSYWLNMRGIDAILGSLPAEAGKNLRSYSFELNFHGWPELINTYVGARKLWDPQASLKTLETEFCSGAFGPQNAPAMVALYEACENGCVSALPAPRDFGTAAYNERLERTLSQSSGIRLAATWKPNFALPVNAQDYIDQLNARLRLILCVSKAKAALTAARQAHAGESEIAALKQDLIRALPDLPIDPLYRQDSSIVMPQYRTATFAEIINRL